MAGVYGGTLNKEHLVWCAYSISPEAGCPLGCRAGDWGDVRRDADGGEDIRVRAIDALLPIGDTAVVNADPRCKLLLTQMAFFPIFSDPTTDLVFHTVTAFSSDTGKNGNSN